MDLEGKRSMERRDFETNDDDEKSVDDLSPPRDVQSIPFQF